MQPTHQQWTWLNDFAKRGFRDIADQDYIAARISYRSKLHFPFFWSSQQCVEKYLKAILLFNAKSAKGLGHNLIEALDRVNGIERLHFHIPSESVEFIHIINKQGPNRYFEHEVELPFGALFQLDKAVWNIRRFCEHFDASIEIEPGRVVNLMEPRVKQATALHYIKNPHKFAIFGGFLEGELASGSEAGKNLLWKNFYYGKRLKTLIRNFTDISRSAVPTHIYHPESLPFLEQYAQIDTGKNPRKPRAV